MWIFKYLRDAFLLDLSDPSFKNFFAPADEGDAVVHVYINIILLAFFAVLSVGLFVYEYRRRRMFLLVRQLIRHKATDAEAAKSLKELGLHEIRGIERMINRGGHIMKVVGMTGNTEYSYEEFVGLSKAKKMYARKHDFARVKFYIRQQMRERADFINERYEVSYKKIILLVVFFAVIYVALMCAMPELMRLLDMGITELKK